MNVVILVPRREDGGHRDELWTFAREWWEKDYPEWPIVEGYDEGTQPFNRALAVNRAAAEAGDWDVAHVIDADVLADPVAVRAAVDLAAKGFLAVAHDRRMMLTKDATKRILDGYRGPWDEPRMVQKTWPDSVSCSVSIPRTLWDRLGGFDESFVGWGFEDTAFTIAAEAVTGHPLLRINADVWHLFHNSNPDSRRASPTFKANEARVARYRAAARDTEAIDELLAEARRVRNQSDEPEVRAKAGIPRILHRTVPAETTEEVERWWAEFEALHPGWDCKTYREPIDPAEWPLTGDLFVRCQNGAQKAGLIRLEALHRDGGVYVDADVKPFRSFEPLLCCEAFAGWEDETTVPDAVLGARPGHPAFEAMIEKARASIQGGGDAWLSGPGVTTETLPGRTDVLVLPPGAFYPFHYLEKAKRDSVNTEPPPYAFVAHQWHHSWGSPAQKASIDRRQR